jgi:hypothetical protein
MAVVASLETIFCETGVARFFLAQNTKKVKNIPMTPKIFTKWPYTIPYYQKYQMALKYT